MTGQWTALLPNYTVPGILPPRPPLCGHAHRESIGWVSDCDARAIFIQTDDDGRAEYACADHAGDLS